MYPIPIVVAGCFIFMFAKGFGPLYFSLFLLNFAFTMNSTVSVECPVPSIEQALTSR